MCKVKWSRKLVVAVSPISYSKKNKEHLLPTVDSEILDVLKSIKLWVLHSVTFGYFCSCACKAFKRQLWEFGVKSLFLSKVGTLLLITVALGGHQLTTALIHANLLLSGALSVDWRYYKSGNTEAYFFSSLFFYFNYANLIKVSSVSSLSAAEFLIWQQLRTFIKNFLLTVLQARKQSPEPFYCQIYFTAIVLK